MWIIFIKWCNWAIPTGHKVGVDWVEAARITFHTKALHLDTLKSGRASLQCFHKVGTALWNVLQFVTMYKTMAKPPFCQVKKALV